MIENIPLPTDGSGPAKHAAEFAASLALRFRAKIIVLHAYTPVPAYLGEPKAGTLDGQRQPVGYPKG